MVVCYLQKLYNILNMNNSFKKIIHLNSHLNSHLNMNKKYFFK
jgi:hypothetical protein